MLHKCPYPNCDHAGTVITNNHCISAHGISKDEVFITYGIPNKEYESLRSTNKALYTLAPQYKATPNTGKRYLTR